MIFIVVPLCEIDLLDASTEDDWRALTANAPGIASRPVRPLSAPTQARRNDVMLLTPAGGLLGKGFEFTLAGGVKL
jgi:hypothetical protein